MDIIGTAAQLTKYDRSGVSTNISVNYYRPARGYRTVKIVGEVIKVGRSLHTIEVSVRDKETDQLLAKGIHIKVRSSGLWKWGNGWERGAAPNRGSQPNLVWCMRNQVLIPPRFTLLFRGPSHWSDKPALWVLQTRPPLTPAAAHQPVRAALPIAGRRP